jgi:prevent-host-death family protein
LTLGGGYGILRLVELTSQKEAIMREIQSSEVKARLPHFLDEVERGETIVITRHGRAVAHLIPAPARDRDRVRQALDGIASLRQATGRVTLDELLSSRHEGHSY